MYNMAADSTTQSQPNDMGHLQNMNMDQFNFNPNTQYNQYMTNSRMNMPP